MYTLRRLLYNIKSILQNSFTNLTPSVISDAKLLYGIGIFFNKLKFIYYTTGGKKNYDLGVYINW